MLELDHFRDLHVSGVTWCTKGGHVDVQLKAFSAPKAPAFIAAPLKKKPLNVRLVDERRF